VLETILKVDRLTSIHSRGKFSGVCVEINLEQPLVTHIVIRGYKLFYNMEVYIPFTSGVDQRKDDFQEFLGNDTSAIWLP